MAKEMKDFDKIKKQVQREYEQGYEHIRLERERKRKILEKVLPVEIPDGQVRINLLWKNIKLERGLFVSDSLNVRFLTDDSVTGDEIMKNANMVADYDHEDMDMGNMKEEIVDYCALYGTAVTVVDGYDDEEQQPISYVINPLSVIPDPKNTKGSNMRFIGFERRVQKDFLENNTAFFDIDKIKSEEVSEELRLNDDSDNDANNTINVMSQEGLVDIYDHMMIFNGKKILTTWADNRETLIRYQEIEPLTKTEQANPNKIKFNVQIHRRANKPNSFFGVSIADEILQFQDAVTLLNNYLLISARQSSLGPDIFIDSNLGVNIATLSKKQPGGRFINVDNKMGNIGNGIFTMNPTNPSQFPVQMIQELENYAKENTGAGDVAFGQSPQGTQTKAEIQTLMANANQLLSAVGDSYLRGQKEYWKAHYRCYALNMSDKAKKTISLYQKGRTLAKTLKKKDFIADGKVQVIIESQNQIDKINEKNSAKLFALQGVYLPSITDEYSKNQFLRKLGSCQGIKGFNPDEFIVKSVDEMDAERNLELLNRGEDVPLPELGQDYRTYLAIYSQAVNSPAKERAIESYKNEIINEKLNGMGQIQQPQGGDEQTKNMAMNMLSNQSAGQQGPTSSDVAL